MGRILRSIKRQSDTAPGRVYLSLALPSACRNLGRAYWGMFKLRAGCRPSTAALIALLTLTGVACVAVNSSVPGAFASTFTAATDDSHGVDLRVTVLESAASPSPTPVPSQSLFVPSRSSSTGQASVVPGITQTTATGSAEATHDLGTSPSDTDGVFYVSGVTATPVTDFGPGGGDIVLAFTQKNVTTAPVTSHLKFWVTNVFGMQLAAIDDVAVTDLAPAETRTVTATLEGVGQWTVFTGHVLLTPPSEVRGTALEPVSRDSLIVIPPYFLLVVLASGGALALVLRAMRIFRRARPAVNMAGVES